MSLYKHGSVNTGIAAAKSAGELGSQPPITPRDSPAEAADYRRDAGVVRGAFVPTRADHAVTAYGDSSFGWEDWDVPLKLAGFLAVGRCQSLSTAISGLLSLLTGTFRHVITTARYRHRYGLAAPGYADVH
jgi:hypothetical protein